MVVDDCIPQARAPGGLRQKSSPLGCHSYHLSTCACSRAVHPVLPFQGSCVRPRPKHNRPAQHTTQDTRRPPSLSCRARLCCFRDTHRIRSKRPSPSCRIALLHGRWPFTPRRLPRTATHYGEEYGTETIQYWTTFAIGHDTAPADRARSSGRP
jgi:hypothetical protein